MKKRALTILLLISVLLCLSAWSFFSPPSTFNIQFIDVGQGDAALVECDGHYMLIDAGTKEAGNKVYSVLEEQKIRHLDILALSHLHADHIGGLVKPLPSDFKIDKTIANSSYIETEIFKDVKHKLNSIGAQITVPNVGDKYQLGSAKIEVVDVAATSENDSLVLMITYGKTRFLFTGDIEDEAQTRISDKYKNKKDKAYKIDLIKMPHHGSASSISVDGTGSLYRFIRTFMPDYAVISVGKNNKYGHPDDETLNLLKDANVKVYRTDNNGDITVKSDGKKLSIETTK